MCYIFSRLLLVHVFSAVILNRNMANTTTRRHVCDPGLDVSVSRLSRDVPMSRLNLDPIRLEVSVTVSLPRPSGCLRNIAIITNFGNASYFCIGYLTPALLIHNFWDFSDQTLLVSSILIRVVEVHVRILCNRPMMCEKITRLGQSLLRDELRLGLVSDKITNASVSSRCRM